MKKTLYIFLNFVLVAFFVIVSTACTKQEQEIAPNITENAPVYQFRSASEELISNTLFVDYMTAIDNFAQRVESVTENMSHEQFVAHSELLHNAYIAYEANPSEANFNAYVLLLGFHDGSDYNAHLSNIVTANRTLRNGYAGFAGLTSQETDKLIEDTAVQYETRGGGRFRRCVRRAVRAYANGGSVRELEHDLQACREEYGGIQ